MKDIGIILIITGAGIVIIGVLVLLAVRLPWLGHMPGDINLHGKSWSLSFPVVTCILASIVLTILLNLILRLFHR